MPLIVLIVAGELGYVALRIVPAALRRSAVCRETDRLLDAAEAAPTTPTIDVPLTELVPTTVGDGYDPLGDQELADADALALEKGAEWGDEARSDGFVQGLHRYFGERESGDVVDLQVLEFRTHAGALKYQRSAIGENSCGSSTESFSIADVPNSIGLQIHRHTGDLSEQVSFVRGPYRFVMAITGGTLPERFHVARVSSLLDREATAALRISHA